jgi:hypothetical protein
MSSGGPRAPTQPVIPLYLSARWFCSGDQASYLVLTHFVADTLQRECLRTIVDRIVPGGSLVVGKHEVVPEESEELVPRWPHLGIYQSGRPRDNRPLLLRFLQFGRARDRGSSQGPPGP